MSINETKKWFVEAVPGPNEKRRAVQFGCHLEEVVEMLENIEVTANDESRIHLDLAIGYLKLLSLDLKQGFCQYQIKDRTAHIDALADQIVTAVGCAHMEGMDIVGALDEVNRSNFSKFVNGKPVFDENGKIKKGANYKEPDLKRFTL